MARVCWPPFDIEYENFSTRMNPPRVSVYNSCCSDCSLIKVDSVNKPGILLQVVQILSDLDIIIIKAYIASDGGWFMDAFLLIGSGTKGSDSGRSKSFSMKELACILLSVDHHIAIELIGRDRPGLLSEISAVLASLHFNVVAAELWTHNRRIASELYVNDDSTSQTVDNLVRLSLMKEQLKNVLRACEDDEKVGHTSLSMGFTHIDRLHQMLFADRDYEYTGVMSDIDYPPSFRTKITIERCEEKGHSVVSVSCKRPCKADV